MNDLPHLQSFFVADGFLAGNYPGGVTKDAARTKLQAILNTGVTCFVDLTQARDELHPYEQLLERLGPLTPRLHLPIRDQGVPETPEQMRRILDSIDSEIVRGGLVYLHCWGGDGRTGTVVGCWLRRHGHRPDEALNNLQAMWQTTPKSQLGGHNATTPETAKQRKYIRDWTR